MHVIVELTVPFEDNFTDDDESRKRDYYEVFYAGNGCRAQLIMIQAGSRGGLAISVQTQADMQSLDSVCCVSKSAISGSCLTCPLH